MATKTVKEKKTSKAVPAATSNKEVIAHAKYVHITPKKLRRVANEVRGLPVSKALSILKSLTHRGADILYKVVKSASSNAAHNNKQELDSLIVSSIMVDDGPRSTRYRPRARGRIFPIIKRSSHVKVGVQSRGVK